MIGRGVLGRTEEVKHQQTLEITIFPATKIVSIIAILMKLQTIVIDVSIVLLKRPCTILALFLLILRLN